MKMNMRFLALPAACLSLTLFGSGCSNSNVNETGSTGVADATKISGDVKPSVPPPSTYKEFYEQQKQQNPAPGKKGAAPPK